MDYLNEIGKLAQNALRELSKLDSNEKNSILSKIAHEILKNQDIIVKANEVDVKNAIEDNLQPSLVDRLTLNGDRISSMSQGILEIAELDDPIGEVLYMKKLKNGLTMGQKRVGIGVIGIIYEARPNVTADAFALCFKSSNCVILRGGKEAINTNKVIVKIIRETIEKNKFNPNFIQLIEDTSREVATEFMKLNKYVDVLIPRGGKGLIRSVVENSTIPTIETGEGNCHIFVDESAKFDLSEEIILNAKTQRTGVCNALETLLIHEKIAKEFLPLVAKKLKDKNVKLIGDEECLKITDGIELATEEDYYTEFLDLILTIKIVKNIDDAINHISKYGTKHSDAILTDSYENAKKFTEEVDSAVVYVNASTRFTDGYEFGFGGEIGISTQKLHARGPMGLKELTTTKYVVLGDWQTRK